MKPLFLLIITSLLISVELNSKDRHPDQSSEFKTYYNRSRGYRIDYPSFLIMGQGSENGDGRSFYSSRTNIKLNVWSSYTDQSMNRLYNDELNDNNYTILYKVFQSSWYVISGVNLNNGKIFYKKVYYSTNEGEVRKMVLEYPTSSKTIIEPLISRIQKSFLDL